MFLRCLLNLQRFYSFYNVLDLLLRGGIIIHYVLCYVHWFTLIYSDLHQFTYIDLHLTFVLLVLGSSITSYVSTRHLWFTSWKGKRCRGYPYESRSALPNTSAKRIREPGSTVSFASFSSKTWLHERYSCVYHQVGGASVPGRTLQRGAFLDS